MRIFHSMGHVVGGALLIAGTAIGVGMLALPVVTGPSGFAPSVTLYFLCWLFMLATALLLVEVSLWLPPDSSFISMAEKILGTPGKVLFWFVYLFLFVTVMTAHVDGGGAIVQQVLGWPAPLSAVLYVLAIVPVVYLGTQIVDRINMALITGVILSYFAFVFLAAPHVEPRLLTYADWGKAWIALPILFTAFTFQVIIPSLITYLKRDVVKIRKSILFGSMVPLAIYLIWEYVILGVIPAEQLVEAAALGQNAVSPLRNYVTSPYLYQVGNAFAFFALTCSFVPLALSFFDFLADGLKWKKLGHDRILLIAAVFGIPTLIALIYPSLFLIALGYAGGVSCAILFGVMPPLLAWVGRYRMHQPKSTWQLPGGKPVLAVLMLLGFAILIGEFAQQFTQ